MAVAKGKFGSLRIAIVMGCVAIAFVTGLAILKESRLEEFSRERLLTLGQRHQQFANLFQGSFYFFYDEQFIPGLRKSMSETEALTRVRILSDTGNLLFDSARPAKPSGDVSPGRTMISEEIRERLGRPAPSVFKSGYEAAILMPGSGYAILYTFDASPIRTRIFLIFLCGFGAALIGAFLFARMKRSPAAKGFLVAFRRLWGLRLKFLATIVLINGITGGIVFFTLSELQTRQEATRLEKEAMLFSQFSTEKIVNDFSNFFYFYYQDRFLPSIKALIATNENLVGVRVISNRTRTVLYDSDAPETPDATETEKPEAQRVSFSPEHESSLVSRGTLSRNVDRGGERLLAVTSVYRNESSEPLFFVEYLFSYGTLAKSVAAIRQQILIDLLPAMGLGLLIAAAFAQLLISPIRRLVAALRRVTEGDFDARVDLKRSDEIGELVLAFNAMTEELRKKRELKKYLSESTYRQVMESSDPEVGGSRLGGSRVEATVLFSDIRNFVTHCEAMEPEEVTSMLNEYFSEMVEVVHKHGGEVDKFIGDAILAVFYEPQTSIQAVYCALEMKERLREFNERRSLARKAVIETGIGITHGEIISGPIGAKDRMDFTVIGDVVNLASRIEGISKQGKHTRIVFSHHVEQSVRGLLEYEPIGEGKIRGKTEDVEVFELIRIREINALVQNLTAQDPALRVSSVELLGYSKNPAGIPPLLEALEDPSERIRVAAVGALSRLAPRDNPRVVDALFRRLKAEKSEKAISAVITGLGRVCASERLLDLREFLDSPDSRIVSNAVETLGLLRSPKAVDLILPSLVSRNNRVKANAAMALFSAGHIEVIDTLKPMLMHSDPLMRSSAAFALGELTLLAGRDDLLEQLRSKGRGMNLFLAELQQCVPLLVSLLRDPETMVKRQAIIALGKIRDRSSILPILDNVDLEKDSPELVQDILRALRAIGSHKLVREVLERLT